MQHCIAQSRATRISTLLNSRLPLGLWPAWSNDAGKVARPRSTRRGSALPAGSGARAGERAPRARRSHRLGKTGYDDCGPRGAGAIRRCLRAAGLRGHPQLACEHRHSGSAG
eukprot:9835469-Alexandrium_andersonii.AAC.1